MEAEKIKMKTASMTMEQKIDNLINSVDKIDENVDKVDLKLDKHVAFGSRKVRKT